MSLMYERNISINDVLARYGENHKIGDRKIIRKAYEFAADKHKGTSRVSGEPYIRHPLRVAHFIAQWGFESDVINAALLHDVVEDCHVQLNEIERLFGTGTRRIVDAVTALSDKDFSDHTLTKEQKDILSDARLQRKMNEKALYVKIADRIDNLSTLDGVPEHKRIPKAEHTREIIMPMAILQHAYAHAELLDQLCFQAEHPQMHQMIESRAERIRRENALSCGETLELLEDSFAPDSRLECSELEKYRDYIKEMRHECRSSVSIFRQISREADNIRRDCEPLLVKEHVAFYDLTLVLSDDLLADGAELQPVELFFLFFEKALSTRGLYLLGYEDATFGNEICFIISDELYNLFRIFVRTEREDQRYQYGSLIDAGEDFSIRDVNEIEPRDTYNEKIRVFRKDGFAMMIDKGATVLDFAFAIHTDLGLHFSYAMVDESKTQLPAYTRLNEGDMITIVANEQVVPSITWFNYVKTRRAIHHLVNFFQGRALAESRV